MNVREHTKLPQFSGRRYCHLSLTWNAPLTETSFCMQNIHSSLIINLPNFASSTYLQLAICFLQSTSFRTIRTSGRCRPKWIQKEDGFTKNSSSFSSDTNTIETQIECQKAVKFEQRRKIALLTLRHSNFNREQSKNAIIYGLQSMKLRMLSYSIKLNNNGWICKSVFSVPSIREMHSFVRTTLHYTVLALVF